MYKCRILIISEHPLFAQGVERLINGQPGLLAVGVMTPSQASESIPMLRPDVVIVDADRAAQPLFAHILRENPGIKFIALSLDNNDINIYYQRIKVSTGVDALLEAIREPLEWKLAERPRLRLLIVTQGMYGQRIAENIRRKAPDHWVVQQWAIPAAAGNGNGVTTVSVPASMPPSELILSLSETPGIADLLPEIARATGARGVIAPMANAEWLEPDQAARLHEGLAGLNVASVFPRPFCSLAETTADGSSPCEETPSMLDGVICEFAHWFGQPAFQIEVDAETRLIQSVQVLRDSPCGCAQYVADRLSGLPVDKAQSQVQMLHEQYPCLASVARDGGASARELARRILHHAFCSALGELASEEAERSGAA